LPLTFIAEVCNVTVFYPVIPQRIVSALAHPSIALDVIWILRDSLFNQTTN